MKVTEPKLVTKYEWEQSVVIDPEAMNWWPTHFCRLDAAALRAMGKATTVPGMKKRWGIDSDWRVRRLLAESLSVKVSIDMVKVSVDMEGES